MLPIADLAVVIGIAEIVNLNFLTVFAFGNAYGEIAARVAGFELVVEVEGRMAEAPSAAFGANCSADARAW